MTYDEVRVPISASKMMAYLVEGGLIRRTRAGDLDWLSICTVNSSIAVASALRFNQLMSRGADKRVLAYQLDSFPQ
jgi:hypothetical protein